MLVAILETTETVWMLVKWYRVSVWDPYDAKNAMNKTFGLLLIDPQIEAFMLLVMLKIL